MYIKNKRIQPIKVEKAAFGMLLFGVEFVTFQVAGNMVTIGDLNEVPSMTLFWDNSNQYKAIAHLNKDKNTYLHGKLLVATIFTMFEG